MEAEAVSGVSSPILTRVVDGAIFSYSIHFTQLLLKRNSELGMRWALGHRNGGEILTLLGTVDTGHVAQNSKG